MKRTLILDEEDLVMVVKEDVVKQVDANRGELNRSEFVNYLIQTQLRQNLESGDTVSRQEFRQFTQETKELLQNFLQFFVSYGMLQGRQKPDSFRSLAEQLQGLDLDLDGADEEAEGDTPLF